MAELPPDWASWRGEVDLAGYDERWRRMADAGANPHGEADLVHSYRPASVLDAGCGTGRVAIELAGRGVTVVGVDLDRDMVAAARAKAPTLDWLQVDLADLDLSTRFEVVVLAGNVVPYIAADRRAAAMAACARHVAPGGRLVTGFQLADGWPTLADLDTWCAGLALEGRFATWERDPYVGGPYAVSVHRADG